MSFEQRCKNIQRRAGKRFKQSTTRNEISNKKYYANFSADILPIETENKFRDILMLWAANFSGESYFYTETVQVHMDRGGDKHTSVEDRVFVISFIYQLFKSSKLGPVILTLRKTLRWREASLDCLIGGQVLFFCMSHGKLLFSDGNALRVH